MINNIRKTQISKDATYIARQSHILAMTPKFAGSKRSVYLERFVEIGEDSIFLFSVGVFQGLHTCDNLN